MATSRLREAAPDPIPYARHSLLESDRDAVERALASGVVAQGPEVAHFEKDLARVTGASQAIAVSSGTGALQLALAALGVGPGDEVIVPSLTFVATANAVVLCGGTPRFADVERDSLTLDPRAVARAVSRRTRGVVAMHYGGHPADAEAIRAALPDSAFLLEDACHALGASLRGRAVGSLGDAACFSFHPAKLITTGEGGAVTTLDPELADRVRRLREHGIERRQERFEGLGLPPEWRAEECGPWVYELHDLAANHRMPELSAALGRSQLGRIDAFLRRRRELADGYGEALSDLEDLLVLPGEHFGARSAWHLYPVRVRSGALRGGRAGLYAALHASGIRVQVHYVPVHLQPWYRRKLGTAFGDLAVTEEAYAQLLSLPLFPALADRDRDRVTDTLRSELLRMKR